MDTDRQLLAAIDGQIDTMKDRLAVAHRERRQLWLRMFESGAWPYKRLMALSKVSKTTLSDELKRARAER